MSIVYYKYLKEGVKMAKLLIMSVVSFCFIFLLLVFFRYILKRYFNYSLNYKVWYLTVLAGLIPFIPIKFSFIKFNKVNNQAPTVESKSHDLNHNIITTKPVQEFATDIHKFNWIQLIISAQLFG